MLPEFGYSQDGGGRWQIDISQAVHGVQSELSQVFGFNPHTGLIQFIGSRETDSLLPEILRQRGLSQTAIKDIVNEFHEGKMVETTYCSDLSLHLDQKPDYVVFVHMQNHSDYLPAVLGEEITHAEHTCALVERVGSFKKYQGLFHELTDEFLGYLGRKAIQMKAGVPSQYDTHIESNGQFTVSGINHLVSYYAVDGILEQNPTLPFRELFQARDEVIFWQAVLRAVGAPFELGMTFPTNFNYQNFERQVRALIAQAKAENAIHFTCHHTE